MTRLAAALAVALVAGALAAPAAAHTEPPPPVPIETPDDVEVTYTVRLDGEPAALVVRAGLSVPESVEAVAVEPPAGAAVELAQGLDASGGTYVSDGDPATAALTYRVRADAPGVRLHAGTGPEWALFARRGLREGLVVNPEYGEDPAVVEAVYGSTPTPVFPGTSLTLLGDYDVVDSSAPGEHRFRVVVPEGASMAADPDEVLAALAFARANFDGGHRHDRVTAFVVDPPQPPGGLTPPGVPEFAVGGAAPIRGADSPWLHQYVHTRQNFSTTADLAWLSEGSAEYGAALLALERGTATWAEFQEVATTDEYADVDLQEGGRAARAAKGAAIVADLDAEIRRATDGRRTFEAVLRRMNRRPDSVDSAEFEAIVEAVAGGSTDVEFGDAVTGTFDPAPPDPRLFGAEAPADRDGPGATGDDETAASTGSDRDAEAPAAEDGTTTARATPRPPTPTERADGTAAPTGADLGPVQVAAFVAWLVLLGATVWTVRRR